MSHVFNPHVTDTENAYALKALLDCLVNINRAYLRTHRVLRLRSSGVRYERTKKWYPIPTLYERGLGDCKSLTGALVAEYLIQGIECRPVFRFAKKRDGGLMFHILVEIPQKNGVKGTLYEDPSRELGMNAHELSYF